MNEKFDIQPLPIEGLYTIKRIPSHDHRGSFERLYCAHELSVLNSHKPLVQINRSVTHNKATVRGLHFQRPPFAELKIVYCLKGEVFDVALDLRAKSPTFGCWHGETLSDKNDTGLIITEGFAHGFQTLKRNCELLYLHNEAFNPSAEAGLSPLDPTIGIDWPLRPAYLSERDKYLPKLTSDFEGLAI